MRCILGILFICLVATHAQAEWGWVWWERGTRLTGSRATIRQQLADKPGGWEAIALFQDKERCKESVMALLSSRGEEWEGAATRRGVEVLYIHLTTLETIGEYAGMLVNTSGDRWSAIEWRCQPR